LGPPGSGKGTQGCLLAQRHDLLLLSTGEVLRQAVAAHTHLGTQVRSSVESGDLVPDRLVIRIVLLRLDENCRRAAPCGFVLDGFPRSVPQAIALDAWAERRGCPLHVAVRLLVSRVELERRLRRRALALGRADDAVDRVGHRIELYEATAPALASYYRRRGLLADVDGEGDEAEVARRVDRAVMRGAVAREDLDRWSSSHRMGTPIVRPWILRCRVSRRRRCHRRTVNVPRWARRTPT
jgi:adenylate kinase